MACVSYKNNVSIYSLYHRLSIHMQIVRIGYLLYFIQILINNNERSVWF